MFTTITSYVNALLAIVANTLLIILILRKSPRSMGSYKYLMLIFSTFGIIFAIVDGTNQPMLHIYNGGVCYNWTIQFSALNCSCYGMILLLLVFHFLYRFLAVCKPHRLDLFSYPYFNILIVIFIVVSLEWWMAGVYAAGENVDVEKHFRETMLENFGLNRLDYTYASSLFYKPDPITGEVGPNMGPIEVLILPIITTQPFMDAIVPMYFIKDYRMVIVNFLRRKKTSGKIHTSSSQPDDRSANSRVFIMRT
ncbi:hypothetical protein CAEBREN_00562 [Caenorhabditis brenneri]|uniref:Uncharacterized protein n=1 Tax=Caenorhabditis brenneri TaxID=135651 RepID=G0N0Q7_CAEBE|nr:hypothetical protein CAEBREN_00562 [Caenorhabditis brenneri]